MEEASIESPGSIVIVEGYHENLRKPYTKLRQKLARYDHDDAEGLQMAGYAMNMTIGPKYHLPTMLVFDAL